MVIVIELNLELRRLAGRDNRAIPAIRRANTVVDDEVSPPAFVHGMKAWLLTLATPRLRHVQVFVGTLPVFDNQLRVAQQPDADIANAQRLASFDLPDADRQFIINYQ